jgi:polyprenyl-phospho-N-acetylgalactosaminyl synthase
MKKNKFLFLIRNYNEGARIENVIKSIFRSGYENILVVDDGSSDWSTRALQYNFPDQIFLVQHAINRGGWAAMETGFEWVRRHGRSFWIEYVVTFDADGQMDIADMHIFESTLKEYPEVEVIFGSRFIRKTHSNIPWYRRMVLLGGKIFTSIISWVHLTDTHNGYRLFSLGVIEKIQLSMDGMEYASELIDQIHTLGYTIKEVPVNIHYDEYTLAKGQRYGGAIRVALRMIYKKFFH